jgi:hypothetical protein
MPELRHPEKWEQYIQRGTRKQQRRSDDGDEIPQKIGLVHFIKTRSTFDKERHTTANQEKWKTCKNDTMTTTANELVERKQKGKQDKETEEKTEWTWI